MSLLRNFATVGGATLLSRLLGFARDVLIAGALGAGPVADAFVAAFRLPNLFRRIFAEGAFNAAFVPMFARALEGDGTAEDREAARSFAAEALAGLTFVLVVFSALAIVFMPWLTYALAPGFAQDPEKFELTVLLSRICFPYLLFISIVALLSGVLNGFRRFGAAALAPVLLNIVLTLTLAGIFWAGWEGRPVAALALSLGVAVAGFAQLAMLIAALHRLGFTIPLRRPRWSPQMRKFVRLGVPGLIAGGGIQIGIWIGTLIASWQPGAMSYLYYADRLYQLPLGLIGIAIGVVLLPEIARRLRAGDTEGALWSQNRALEFALLFTLPATAALAIAATPIVRVLFERGAFDMVASAATAAALMAFALGLPAFVLAKVFQPVYFAAEDTATPMRFTLVQMAINVGGAAVLFPFLGHVGIAVATSVSAWINVALLWLGLYRDGRFRSDERLRARLPRVVIATLAMAAAIYAAMRMLAVPLMTPNSWEAFAALAVLVLTGMVVFAAAAFALGASRLSDLKGIARPPRTVTPTPDLH